MVYTVIALGVFLLGYLTTKTTKNLLSIVALLGSLPISKELVGLIMSYKRKPMEQSVYEQISAKAGNLEQIYENCDIISVHVPLLDSTKKMINAEAMAQMKDGVILLNFARDALVDDDALETALSSGKVKRYITDFPNDKTAGMQGVVAIPHLGASTEESEDNCAMMAVRQTMDYLENGNITNSVNFPACSMGICTKPGRVTILHRNVPNTISQFTAALAADNINISDMVNRSKGEYAYSMFDLDEPTPAAVAEHLAKIEDVFRVRVIR
jgi:D-3-phosphoglycerate dehydrogenase